jgi:tetratricopeptide (TPR) repeat protein
VSGKPGKAQISPAVLTALSLLKNDERRGAFLRKHKLLRTDAILELNAATQQELRVNTKNALSLAESAIVAASGMRKKELIAQSYRMKANVLAASGEYQAAVELYDAALALFQKEKDQEGLGRTLTAAIQPHIMLGAYDRAFDFAKRAQKIFRKLKDERRLARLENNIGNIYHRQDRFEEATPKN